MMRRINRRRFLELSATAAAATTLASIPPLIEANSAAAASNLAGYWKFDEGSGSTASDASGNGYIATLASGATWGTGQIGSHALSLTGASDSYASIPQAIINTANSFTASAWVKVNTVSGAYQTFVSVDGSQVSAFYLQLRGDSGKFSFTRLGTDSTSAGTHVAVASVPPVTGTWYHLAGVYDASLQTISLYVNGSLQQTVAYSNGWQGSGSTAIGRGQYGGNHVDFVNGQIDDVHIYNVALDAKSIADLAAAGYWTFDEGRGTTAADSTGNSYNATLASGAAWAVGQIGASSLSLNGASNSYANIAAAVVNTAESFAVTAWVKLSTLSEFQTFVSLDGNHVSAFALQLLAGRFAFARPVSDVISTRVAVASAASEAKVDVWYHLAGVYDAGAKTLALYVNGILQEIVAYPGDWQGSGNTIIGRGKFAGKAAGFTRAQIDDVHIYNIVLDYTAINTLAGASPATHAALTVQVNESGPSISPTLYGLMFEDINHSGDGGLYAELIRNRSLKEDWQSPLFWSVVNSSGAAGSIALDWGNPTNTVALDRSLKFEITQVTAGQRVGVANTGFWGIPVRAHTTYHASFYAQASADFGGPLTIGIESNDGSTVYASATVHAISTSWQKYSVTLRTEDVASSETNRFVISASHTGTIWFNLVSLFPPTWKNRPNGLRPDLMRLLRDMHPTFLRFPGGAFLEGYAVSDAYNWKKTIGDLSQRPGHIDLWGYVSTDGLGLLEYLEWCEDLYLSPVMGVYAGYSLDNKPVPVGTPQFNQFIQDALDEIEYATGSTSTTWGAVRAANGHPDPFTLEYVEIGNEDFFDTTGSYDGRFTAFYDAIKAAYPRLKVIATTTVTSRVPDIYDQHFYASADQMASLSSRYNTYSRSAPKVFVGEYASQEGTPTPDLNSALGDAAFLTGLERNSDVVILSSYAPLMANVNNVAWKTNLIAFDALNSYGSPSYYMQQMFSIHHGDVVVPAQLSGVGGLYFVSSKNTDTGTVYIKVVNPAGTAQPVQIMLNTANRTRLTGEAIVLSSSSPSDTNTLSEPTKIVPVTHSLGELLTSFNYSFAPYSVTVLIVTMNDWHEPD